MPWSVPHPNCGARLWAGGDPRPAFRTYPAGCHTSAVSGALDYTRLPRNKAKSVSRKHDRHRERAAGHALAVRAVAGVDHVGRLGDLVAERTALAAIGLQPAGLPFVPMSSFSSSWDVREVAPRCDRDLRDKPSTSQPGAPATDNQHYRGSQPKASDVLPKIAAVTCRHTSASSTSPESYGASLSSKAQSTGMKS
jgi:hypothetical protein